jgi:glycosyltransferase involved in cell wall biosynthesis
VFVQSPAMRRVVNAMLRTAMIPELEVIAFSEGERRALIETVGVPPERVHKLVWGGPGLFEGEEVTHDGPPYVFSGGYANRDYATLFSAVERLPYPVVVVAANANRIADPPANVELRIDLPEAEFIRLLAGAQVLVVPLRAAGEASGQSVLLYGIQHRRPIVATRHDALIDYLGPSYAGFVPARDPAALAAAIDRAMSDEGFRRSLIDQVSSRRESLRRQRDDIAVDVLAMLEP